MSDPFEQQLGDAMQQAAELARLMTTTAVESVLSKRLYERVPWEKVSQFAAEGWELTAVMSDGLHVMQRQVGPAEQVTDAVARMMDAP